MKETVKLAGGIILKSVAKWALVFFLGCAVTVISFLISFLWNIDLLFVEELTFSKYFRTLLSDNLPAFLIIFGAPIFVIVYIVMAKKISIQNSIFLIFQSPAGDQIISVLATAVDKITKSKGWHSKLINKAIVKVEVLQTLKDDPETSGIQRSIIQYGFRKVNLEDIDFQDQNLNISKVLTAKFSRFFAEMIKPSLMYFWILIGVQMVLSIWSLFLR